MKRLHVIIRNDLSSFGLMAAQGGHALAAYLIEHKPQLDGEWNNDYLIVLQANEKEFHKLIRKLEWNKTKYSSFKEPDLDNQLTSIAILNNSKMFKKLKPL